MVVLLEIIALLPYVGLCIALPLLPVAYVVAGLVVVRVVDFVPGVGQAAQAGMVTGLVASLIGGVVAMFLAPIRLAIAGGSEPLVASLPPEVVERLLDAGLDPVAVVDFLGGVGAGLFCCSLQILGGVLLAATGAALYAAFRQT
jgi:hypothetical protein